MATSKKKNKVTKDQTMELGCRCRDKVTGFEGIMMGKCEYYTGCIHWEVVSQTLNKDRTTKSKWIDETRLERTGNGILKKVAKGKSGGPCDDPPGCS